MLPPIRALGTSVVNYTDKRKGEERKGKREAHKTVSLAESNILMKHSVKVLIVNDSFTLCIEEALE